ncbi:MrcB family domain-containing protein [Bacillus weihaiensis]|uniref:MrcB family domain-containing protein n=1 Tax=Bacillus weihaiensis TaxID=1547283 RepID=UPI002352CBD9|nr:DUF3578 domain-containing protein [Bacillus weihaiensis]
MILYLLKELVKKKPIIHTLTTHKPNKITKVDDTGIYVETETSKEKYEKGERSEPTDFLPWNLIEQGWDEFIQTRVALANDFEKARGRSSFLMALFNELPFVEQTVKENKTAIKLKEYTTDQLPEASLEQCITLLNEIIEGMDPTNITKIYKEDNIKRLKSRARQGLKLIGILNDSFQVNNNIIEKYKDSSNKKDVLKEQLLHHNYFNIVLKLLEIIPTLSKQEKLKCLIDVGMLVVRNSRGENLMVESVAEYRTRNILQWLEQVGLVDEEWNVKVDGELRSSLLKVMNEYQDAKNGPFAGHELGGTVRNVIPSLLGSLYFIDKNQYTIKGSIGQGNWASVPWVAVMNNLVTTSTQRGYYIVYLFSEDMKSLYLTLAQGVTETTRDEMERISQAIRNSIPMSDRVIKGNDLNLGQSSKAREYELSTAAYIPYSIDHMPPEDQLIKDLEEMVGYYEEFIMKNDTKKDIVADPPASYYSMSEIIEQINTYIASKGFYYQKEEIINLFLSLKTKPFVIISGISGTGKTKIVQWFAESIGATEDNGQFSLIPVRPDWNDGSDLLGYVDIKGDFKEGPLTKVLKRAEENPTLPYFVLLDEMNLARVEYYFSDMLSVMESRRWEDGEIVTSKLLSDEVANKTVTLPPNVYIIGTVNMDETTHPFSKKVLDRANTIEFNEVNLSYLSFLNDLEESERLELKNEQLTGSYLHLKDVYKEHSSIVETATYELVKINDILKPIGAHIGYRVRDEICFYLAYNEEGSLFSFEQAFDRCVLQKILPRISGSDYRVQSVLDGLYTFCTNKVYSEDVMDELSLAKYPKCAQKIVEMRRRLVDDGFTSFWIGS